MNNNKETMHMFSWYQNFYLAAKTSKAFEKYCKTVFGINFSQHGFSDIKQINKMIEAAKIKESDVVLD